MWSYNPIMLVFHISRFPSDLLSSSATRNFEHIILIFHLLLLHRIRTTSNGGKHKPFCIKVNRYSYMYTWASPYVVKTYILWYMLYKTSLNILNLNFTVANTNTNNNLQNYTFLFIVVVIATSNYKQFVVLTQWTIYRY